SASDSARRLCERQKGLRPPTIGVTKAWRVHMSEINRTRTVLIREGTPLPTALPIESEAFLPGWRIVKNLDRQALARAVEEASWNFFYLAGEMRAIVLGRERSRTLRRAIKSMLARQEGQKFNSLEITKIVSKR